MTRREGQRVSDECLREVRQALERYQEALLASPLKLSTTSMRYQGARRFVDWLTNQYRPGQGLRD